MESRSIASGTATPHGKLQTKESQDKEAVRLEANVHSFVFVGAY